ncbi:hypothetical protein PLEOSDRAFT_1090686 [Pleurotus ostreatus PC15]|uniref:Uncharacterized protein n=1 Tax=Pleurotus ostreatus (strain PC15) TaxID=1137138 RepID=A0A067N8G7_PLEO1|nr:hypothetical protein PLEOSDRAFT_1090686 [Pleurotus ostreatus PC15]
MKGRTKAKQADLGVHCSPEAGVEPTQEFRARQGLPSNSVGRERSRRVTEPINNVDGDGVAAATIPDSD